MTRFGLLAKSLALSWGYLVLWLAPVSTCISQETPADQEEAALHSKKGHDNPPNFELIAESTWEQIERSVDRGVEYLIRRQNPNGTFGGTDIQATGITSLCAMAMISRGHNPTSSNGASRFSTSIDKSVDYVLSVVRENGLISHRQSDYSYSVMDKAAIYNHAIAGMFLCEVYGMVDATRAARIEKVIPKSLSFLRRIQQRPLAVEDEELYRGGWRYDPAQAHQPTPSDLSVTGWIVMFMRSAENAGFDVPRDWADQALAFVERCYVKRVGAFTYEPAAPHMITRGMTGAGVLCLFLTGKQRPEMEQACGEWLINHPPTVYNRRKPHEHYHYSMYYSSQAALQLGGEVWANVYTTIYQVLLKHQESDGSWRPESRRPEFGDEYTTALSVLALTPPYQLLPIYQR